MSDPVQQFDKLHAATDILFVVCTIQTATPQSYLKQLQSLTDSIAAANGVPVTVTAKGASELPAMRTASGYTGETILDPDNLLAQELKQRGLLDVAISDKKGYPNGMAQPAVLVLKKDGTVFFKWAIVPAFMNFGDAKDRPSLNEIWENAESQVGGGLPVHRQPSKIGAIGELMEKVFG